MPLTPEQKRMTDQIHSIFSQYLHELQDKIHNEEAPILDDLMQNLATLIDLVEQMHINIILTTVGTAIANAKKMLAFPDVKDSVPMVVLNTKRLLARCIGDFESQVAKQLNDVLETLDAEDLWHQHKSHNEIVADEIIESLRNNDGADQASQSAQKKH